MTLRLLTIACLIAHSSTFLAPTPTHVARHSASALCTKTPTTAARVALRGAGLQLKMAEGGTSTVTLERGGEEAKQRKRETALKLAAQAREALAQAEKAEAESAKYKGSTVRVSIGSELNAKSALGRIADITYPAWVKSFESERRGRRGVGQDTEAEKMERVRATLERLDLDASGGIDKAELAMELEGLGLDASPATVDALFEQADANGDETIDFDEFYTVMKALITREEAASLEQEIEADASAAAVAAAPKVLEKDDVLASLSGATLVGAEEGVTSKFLSELKEQGSLQKWNSYDFTMQDYSADRLVALTGVKDPDTELGVQVTGLVRKRLQISRFAGLSALMIVFFSGLLPDSVEGAVRQLAWGAYLANLCVPLIARQLDSALVDLELNQDPTSSERWARRQAGRFLAAYLTGVPLTEVDYENRYKPELVVASKQSGNIDLEAAWKEEDEAERREYDSSTLNVFESAVARLTSPANTTLAYGLTDKEVQTQAVIQTAGVMAEYYEFGGSTLGYKFLEKLDAQFLLSASLLDASTRNSLTRFGFVQSAELVRDNEALISELQTAVGQQKPVEELIAIIESHPRIFL